jgi:hypothetical protein
VLDSSDQKLLPFSSCASAAQFGDRFLGWAGVAKR